MCFTRGGLRFRPCGFVWVCFLFAAGHKFLKRKGQSVTVPDEMDEKLNVPLPHPPSPPMSSYRTRRRLPASRILPLLPRPAPASSLNALQKVHTGCGETRRPRATSANIRPPNAQEMHKYCRELIGPVLPLRHLHEEPVLPPTPAPAAAPPAYPHHPQPRPPTKRARPALSCLHVLAVVPHRIAEKRGVA
jgi:hypothetical protein